MMAKLRVLLFPREGPRYWLFCLGLVLVYLVARWFNLTVIPVFADEAIYIRWAQVMRAESGLRFLPLSDGKQPLFMWLAIPFLKLVADPLVAGRLVSVLSGLAGLLGVFIFSQLLFKDKLVSLFSAILYLVVPFISFFNRLALPDNLLAIFFLWSLIFYVLTIKTLRLDLAMLAGITVGLAWLTKSPAVFLLVFLPVTLLLFDFKQRPLKLRLGQVLGFWLVVSAFGLVIYNLLRLGPEFHMIALRNQDYLFSLAEILQHPLNPLLGNLKSLIGWFWVWLTPGVFLLGLVGIWWGWKGHRRSLLFLLILFAGPLLLQSAAAKVYTARYVLFTVPFWLIFSAIAVAKVFTAPRRSVLTTLLLAGLFVWPVYQQTSLLLNPQRAWIPANERSGYLEMWTAGYGIKESADYLKEVAKTQRVLVGTEGYFGTLPDGLQMYLEKVPNLTVIGIGYPIKEVPKQLSDGLLDGRVFLVANNSRLEIAAYGRLKLREHYPKAASQDGKVDGLLLYELLPE